MENPCKPQSWSTIRESLPLIPLDLLQGISQFQMCEKLLTHDNLETYLQNIAKWIANEPSLCIGTNLPGLWILRDQLIPTELLPVRIIHALKRLSIRTWGDVIEWTPSFIGNLKGFNEGCLQPFLEIAINESLKACSKQRPPSIIPLINTHETQHFLPKTDLELSHLWRLAEWVLNESQSKNLAEALQYCKSENMPCDIAAIFESINLTALSKMFPSLSNSLAINDLIIDLFEILDTRSSQIFKARISQKGYRTLEDLAGELGITRERVRQLFVSIEQRIQRALRTSRFAPILWRAHTVKIEMGIGFPAVSDNLFEITNKILRDILDSNKELAIDLLFWIAGPYSLHAETGWIKSGELPEANIIKGFLNTQGLVEIELLVDHLKKLGLHQNAIPLWINQFGRLRKYNNKWIVWNGTVIDKSIQILHLSQKPLTTDELVEEINEGHDVKGLRNRIMEDERIIRIDKNRFGLRCWGLEEYSTIAGEIDQEIENQGGIADFETLTNNLVTKFGLREASIRLYANAPMFYRKDGTIRQRLSTDGFDPTPPVTETPGCFVLNQSTLFWRIQVSGESLRGSGRTLPPTITGWLNLTPGSEQILTSDQNSIRVTWPESSPVGGTLGSIRSLLESIFAEIGDMVFVCFDRERKTISLFPIDKNILNSSNTIIKISALTGISYENNEHKFIVDIGKSIACNYSHEAIYKKLNNRGEFELADLFLQLLKPKSFHNECQKETLTLASTSRTIEF